MHTRKQQFNAAYCAEPGSGKSYAALTTAELIDRRSDDVCRFDISRVAFNVEDFFELTDQNLPIGSAIILDDSALAALSSETLKREVRQLTKCFISMRHRRFCVLLTFPSIKMLSSNILRTLLYYIEMRGINEKTNQSTGVSMRMQCNPRSGKIYYHKPTFVHNEFRNDLGFDMPRTYFRPSLLFDLPSNKLIKDYEVKRKQEMRRFYLESKAIVSSRKEKKVTFADELDKVQDNLREYLDEEGKVSKAKLMRAGISHYRAMEIKKFLDKQGNRAI